MKRRTPTRSDDPALERSLDRQLALGLLFAVLLFAGFPLYSIREPARLAQAAKEQHDTYARLGADQFSLHCASCHGVEGGGGASAPTLRARELLSTVSNTQLRWLVAGGSPGTVMSPYHIDFGGPFTDQHVEQVVTYLRSLEADAVSVPGWKTGAPAPARPTRTARANVETRTRKRTAASEQSRSASSTVSAVDDADAVRPAPLFAQYCAACHGAAGEGVPNLGSALLSASYRAQRDDSTIARLITEGVPGKAMMAFASDRGGPLGTAQIAALVAAIRRGTLHD